MNRRLIRYGLIGLPLVLTLAVLGVGGLWLAHVISLETVLTTIPAEGFQTPALDEDVAWASAPGPDPASGDREFRGENAFLSGACFPTEPALDVKSGEAQNGFRELFHVAYPGRNLYRSVGLNFEHILSGHGVDEPRNWFSPRKEACELRVKSEESVSLFWPAESSAWGAASEMTYTLADGPCLDMTFRTTLRDSVDRPYLDLRVQKPGRPHDLFHHTATRQIAFVFGGGGRYVYRLVDAFIELVELQGAVVISRRQAETVIHQHLLP